MFFGFLSTVNANQDALDLAGEPRGARPVHGTARECPAADRPLHQRFSLRSLNLGILRWAGRRRKLAGLLRNPTALPSVGGHWE